MRGEKRERKRSAASEMTREKRERKRSLHPRVGKRRENERTKEKRERENEKMVANERGKIDISVDIPSVKLKT